VEENGRSSTAVVLSVKAKGVSIAASGDSGGNGRGSGGVFKEQGGGVSGDVCGCSYCAK